MRGWIDLFEGVLPSVLWHGSDTRIEGPYRALTHFGTQAAADQRADTVLRDWKRMPDPTHYDADGPVYADRFKWLHPVHLNLQNPLRIHDGVALEHSPIALADMLFYDLRVIYDHERSLIFRAGKFGQNLSDNRAAAAEIVRLLSAKGYDGFVYRNLHEDPGSESFVNFYPEQVTPAGEPLQFPAN